MKKWVVYCAGNSEYIMSDNREPIRMLLSFKKHFGTEMDYVYFTDVDEPNLEAVKNVCERNGIRLIFGSCKKHYEKFCDIEYISINRKPRWPDAHYWYCEAPKYLHTEYDYAIKCDGDMFCAKHFDLESLEAECAITIAKEPSWFTPTEKYCPNAGFQILNLHQYIFDSTFHHFRKGSQQPDTFKGDTPLLNFLILNNIIKVNYVGSEYNYTLYDMPQARELSLSDVENVNIFHFTETKPHNLHPSMKGTVKDYFGQQYLAL